jgi:hypothetical protein
MTNLFLEPSEIEGLTSRVRRNAQVKFLRAMGVEHKVRPDGSLAVLRDHVAKVFGGGTTATERRHKPAAPNWAAI